MRNEEKLIQLFTIAEKNGWKIPEDVQNAAVGWSFDIDVDVKTASYSFQSNYGEYELSINDLIVNWEEDEVSFLDALCKVPIGSDSKYGFNYYPDKEKIVDRWTRKPTNLRLEQVLFEEFKHLLTDE